MPKRQHTPPRETDLYGPIHNYLEAQGYTVRAEVNHCDVTARKAAEEALRASEEQYRGLIENLNVGVYRNTPDGGGRFLHANPAMVRIFGYEDAEEFMRFAAADVYQNPADRASF